MTDDIRSKVADAIESAIHDALHPFTPYSTVADAAIAAYQQARRIETVAQLDALPDRTVVRSREEVMGDPVERAAEALERFRVVDLTSAFARGNVAKAVVDALGLTKEAK